MLRRLQAHDPIRTHVQGEMSVRRLSVRMMRMTSPFHREPIRQS